MAIDRRLRESGSFKEFRVGNCGRPRIREPDAEERVLDLVDENPDRSTRHLAAEVGMSHMAVWRVLHEQQLYPYHVQTVQALQPGDYAPRLVFCRWLRQKNLENDNFVKNILSTDEATFTRNGVTNHHNSHLWADENPRAKKETHYQNNFSVNVWAGIVDNFLIGPFFLPHRLSGAEYLNFLRNDLPNLLQEVPLAIQENMWFLQDGAPPHYSREVRNFLGEQFPERWIGRGAEAPIKWPARSPDLNPLDFCFWGYMKEKVYSVQVDSVEHLRERIINTADSFRQKQQIFNKIRFSFLKRCVKCIDEGGGHFEHLLK